MVFSIPGFPKDSGRKITLNSEFNSNTLKTIFENSYLIFKEDFKRRSVLDWLKSHFTGAPPPHKYKGTLFIHGDKLIFSTSNQNTVLSLDKRIITEIYLGFDKTFNTFQTRGLGLTWQPLRIEFLNEKPEKDYLYLVTGFRGFGSENKQLMEILQLWLS